jgi:hypothetical protein
LDPSSKVERDLIDLSSEPWATFGLSASPNRKFFAARTPGPGEAGGRNGEDASSAVVLYSVDTGGSRRLWTQPFSQAFSGSVEWLPDSSGVIVTKLAAPGGGRREAWLVPINGEAPRKLDLGVQNLLPAGVRLAPNGRSLAILAGDRRNREVQVLERVVPGSQP